MRGWSLDTSSSSTTAVEASVAIGAGTVGISKSWTQSTTVGSFGEQVKRCSLTWLLASVLCAKDFHTSWSKGQHAVP
jgi:hypothetical protein